MEKGKGEEEDRTRAGGAGGERARGARARARFGRERGAFAAVSCHLCVCAPRRSLPLRLPREVRKDRGGRGCLSSPARACARRGRDLFLANPAGAQHRRPAPPRARARASLRASAPPCRAPPVVPPPLSPSPPLFLSVCVCVCVCVCLVPPPFWPRQRGAPLSPVPPPSPQDPAPSKKGETRPRRRTEAPQHARIQVSLGRSAPASPR